MTQSDERGPQPSIQDVALIVGGGPGISSSCARLFAENGMRVGVAARTPDKPVLQTLEKTHGVRRYACDASEPAAVELLFKNVVRDLGAPTLLVHNIDGRVPGIFGKAITDADPSMVLETLRNSAFSAFLVGQQAARTHARKQAERPRRERNDHLHERKCGTQGFPVERRLRHGMPCQVRARPEHGEGIDAAGHPRRQCADRRRDRLDAGRRQPRAPTGRNDRRRQHGRPRLHRGDLSAAASPASVDLGVRSRATAVGREMVRRLRRRFGRLSQTNVCEQGLASAISSGIPFHYPITKCLRKVIGLWKTLPAETRGSSRPPVRR